ncbi:unnamed protein product [Ambrosiozyma monospora]|uniref:Unnamed protein product n=1 Tax=Ambrosiozyma monospora TaxID=43982 RepID=A0ACB5U3S2_AMBMO|nr:unnamed protein product [Ambrosiozyma monospora]
MILCLLTLTHLKQTISIKVKLSKMSLQQLSPSLINLIRLSSALNAKDVNFFKQIDSDISKQLDSLDTRFVSVINTLLKTIETEDDMDTELGEDDSANWKIVSDLLDSLFEKTEISLDEHKLHKTSNSDGFTYLDSNPTNHISQT